MWLFLNFFYLHVVLLYMCCVSVWLSLVSVWALLSWGYVWRFVLKPIHYVFLYGRIFFFFFFPRLRVEENNTFTVVFPNPQHIHFHLLFHAVDLKLFTAFFFFCPVFVFSCCGVFSFFAAGSAAGALQKIPTTSCKQQAVRMTSSCHKVFYVSLRSHSFHSSLHCCKSTQCHV